MAAAGVTDREKVERLIAEAERWRAHHKARGSKGDIEAAACSIRIRALKDVLEALFGD